MKKYVLVFLSLFLSAILTAEATEITSLEIIHNQPSDRIAVNTAVTFDITIVGGTQPFIFLWDKGDGTQSNLAQPSFTYTSARQFTVSVTVTDVDSHSLSARLTLTIYDPNVGGAGGTFTSPETSPLIDTGTPPEGLLAGGTTTILVLGAAAIYFFGLKGKRK